jgi:phage/plasmid-like protein (TIGR03299 family)
MAHELTINRSGLAEMAYVGATPWHGLGQNLNPNAGIEEWRQAAGLNWEIMRSKVQFMNGEMHTINESEVLYRNDTNAPLSIVSNRYHIVQPGAVLEFFKDLVADDGFQIETAGTLKGGKRIWALARTGFDGEVVDNDPLKTYLLLVTSCDGGLATTAEFTSVRVVCNNTLTMSLSAGSHAMKIKVRHNTMFDPLSVKGSLGLNAKIVFNDFMEKMQSFSEKSISHSKAEDVISALFSQNCTRGVVQESKGFKTVMQLFEGAGKGSKIKGVAGTGWGLVNAVTEYADFHIRASSNDNRLNSAWFGSGASLKRSIVDLLETI